MNCHSCQRAIEKPRFIYAFFTETAPICNECSNYLARLAKPHHDKCGDCKGNLLTCLNPTHLTPDYVWLCCVPGCGNFMTKKERDRIWCQKHFPPKRKAEIIVDLGVDPDQVVFSDHLLVSIDCDHCQRTGRSVSFSREGAKCFPGSAARWGGYVEHPPYPGKLVDLEIKKVETGVRAIYSIEYATNSFKDFKYEYREWRGYPTWGRIYFTLACQECGHVSKRSTQTNMCRPYNAACKCGHFFYTEKREMPIIRWLDPDTGESGQLEERFGAKEK